MALDGSRQEFLEKINKGSRFLEPIVRLEEEEKDCMCHDLLGELVPCF